ncbi:MAG: hypothetical protein Q8J92_14300 [Parvibaculum sp.]|nr:hypothetical protein [Parvibaculum sp.]
MSMFAICQHSGEKYLRGQIEAVRLCLAHWGEKMDLFLFRLSLKAKEMADLFEARDPEGRPYSRENWLRHFFEREREFLHYKNKFVMMPVEDLFVPRLPHLRFVWIARELQKSERTPPSEGLEPTKHPSWQASFLAIDPTDHQDGQLIALEHNDEIGIPKAIINSLIKALNDDIDAPYFVQAFPLVRKGSFWEFALQHRDEIKSVTFAVAAPNMFKDADDFQEEYRSLRDGENVSSVRATLESDTALKHRTERMTGLINYVERGAGELSAEATDGTRYHSSEHEMKTTADIENHKNNLATFLREIVAVLDRIFP